MAQKKEEKVNYYPWPTVEHIASGPGLRHKGMPSILGESIEPDGVSEATQACNVAERNLRGPYDDLPSSMIPNDTLDPTL